MCTCVRYGKETGNKVSTGNISLLPWLYWYWYIQEQILLFLIFKDESHYKDWQLLFKNQTTVKSHQKLQEFHPFFMILKLQLWHWVFPPDTGQCSPKNWPMSYKSCFLTDTFVHHEVKKTVSYRRLKTQKHLERIGLLLWFFFL